MLEFFWSPYKNNLMVQDLANDDIFNLSEDKKELIDKICVKLQEDYPDTWSELLQNYTTKGAEIPLIYAIKFKMVNRFLKCNFSVHDNKPDIDDDWNFDFEKVPCPLRGECRWEYCNPQLTTNLSKRELEIVPLLVEGFSHQQIGDRLYVSGPTIKNHSYKIMKKLGFTGKPHPEKLLINYAYKNGLVNL